MEGNQFERGLKLLDENQRFLEEVTQDDLGTYDLTNSHYQQTLKQFRVNHLTFFTEKQAIVRHVKGGCLKGAKKFEEAKAVLEVSPSLLLLSR